MQCCVYIQSFWVIVRHKRKNLYTMKRRANEKRYENEIYIYCIGIINTQFDKMLKPISRKSFGTIVRALFFSMRCGLDSTRVYSYSFVFNDTLYT